MAFVLPPSPTRFQSGAWPDILSLYEELAARPLDAGAMPGWLEDWSRLEAMVAEAAALAMIAYTVDTGDREREATHLRFSTEIMPRVEE